MSLTRVAINDWEKMGHLGFLVALIAISSFVEGAQVLQRWTPVKSAMIDRNAGHENSHTG